MSKLDNKMQKKIEVYLQRGNYIETICDAVGITDRTFHYWMEWGRKISEEIEDIEERAEIFGIDYSVLEEYKRELKRNKYFLFFQAVKKAQGEGEILLVEKVRDAADDQWQAAAWMLERKFPDKYGRNSTVKLRGDKENPLQINQAPVFENPKDASRYWQEFIRNEYDESEDDE